MYARLASTKISTLGASCPPAIRFSKTSLAVVQNFPFALRKQLPRFSFSNHPAQLFQGWTPATIFDAQRMISALAAPTTLGIAAPTTLASVHPRLLLHRQTLHSGDPLPTRTPARLSLPLHVSPPWSNYMATNAQSRTLVRIVNN
jgi:hypothetical protein